MTASRIRLLSLRRLTAATLAALFAQAVAAGPNEDAAFRVLYPKAEAGNADAQFALGKIYLDGTSSAGRDIAKGFEYINRSASAGNKNAMRLIVDRVESRAIEVCLKLQQAGDSYCESRLPGMVKRMIPRSPNAASCKKLEEIHASGLKVDPVRFELAYCAATGLSSLMTSAEAVALLRTEGIHSREAFLKTMDAVLKPNSPDWDPLYVEDNLPKSGLGFRDKEVGVVFARHGVTLEGCRRLDPLRRETVKQRPSVCRMAARAGDGEAALYVGSAYMAGKDYFPKDPKAAAEFINEAIASTDPGVAAKGFALMLTLLKSEGRIYDHLALVDREITRRTANVPTAVSALSYEFDYLVQNHDQMKLEDIVTIAALADDALVGSPQKVRVAFALDDVLKDRGGLLKAGDREMLKSYRRKLAGEPVLESESPKAVEKIEDRSVSKPSEHASVEVKKMPAQDPSILEQAFETIRKALMDRN